VRDTWEALLDVTFALTVLATFAVSILTLLNDGSRDDLARAYARRFQLATEDQCPMTLGKPFWFACASETRRLNPPPPSGA
jgi:hypothetical protein